MEVMNMFDIKCNPEKEEQSIIGESKYQDAGVIYWHKETTRNNDWRARQGMLVEKKAMEEKHEQNQSRKDCW